MKLHSLLLIVLASITFVNGPQPLSNLPITTVFAMTDASGAVAEIQSDSLGPYHDGVDGVTSFLTTNGYNGIVWGDWQFGTLNSATRKVYISFVNPILVINGGPQLPIHLSPRRT